MVKNRLAKFASYFVVSAFVLFIVVLASSFYSYSCIILSLCYQNCKCVNGISTY